MDTEQTNRDVEPGFPSDEYLFRLLIEGVEDYAIYVIDAQGKIVTWNTGATRLKGYPREEAVGRNFDMFFLPEDRAAGKPQALLATAAADGRAEDEGWRQRKDGALFWAHVSIRALYDAGGALIGFAKVTRDRTERKQAEAQLRALNAELEQRVRARTAELEARNRELETFTYSVSHDLKAPLRGIDGYGKLLLEEYADKLDAEGRRFLQVIRRSTDHMNRLIDDLLAYSRLDRRKLQPGLVEPHTLIAALLAERGDEIAQRGVQIQVAVPPRALQTDYEGLTLALRNLLDNALKFTRDTPAPAIEIGGTAAQDGLTLWVRDNGIGFEMKHHDRIFEIFQRLHRADEYAGTGIGLAIVRRALERMGGRTWADSSPGGPTTFYIQLPLLQVQGLA